MPTAPRVFGFKGACLFLLAWSCASNTMIAFLPTYG